MTIDKIYGLVYEAKQSADLFTAKQYLTKIADQLGDYIGTQKSRSIGQFDRRRTAMRLLKSVLSRPILAKAIMVDGIQKFTDSFTAYQFVGDSIIQELPTHTDEEAKQYPSLDRHLNAKTELIFSAKVEDLKAELRKIPPHETLLKKTTKQGFVIAFERKRLYQFLVIMGFKEKDVIDFEGRNDGGPVNPLQAVTVRKADGSKGIILPVRFE